MGAGLLAKAVGQAMMMLKGWTPSRASSLPQGSRVKRGFVNTRATCGSGLARDGSGSGNDDVEGMNAFPSRLAPTRDLGWNGVL